MYRIAERAPAISACVVLFLAFIAPTRAEDLQPGKKLDTEAKKVLDDFGAYFKSLNSLCVTIETHISSQALGQKAEQSSSLQLGALRPNKLAFTYAASNSDLSQEWTFSCDGANCSGAMIVNLPSKPVARYATDKAPEGLNDLIRNSFVATGLMSATMVPIPAAMLSDDPAASVLATATSVTYAGREVVDGVECHVIRSVAEATTQNAGRDFDWQLWIECSDRPLIRKSRVTSGGITSKFVTLNLVATYKDWQVNQPVPDSTFVFARPDGTTEEQSFRELLTGNKPAKKTDLHTPHPLVGKAAPAVKLPSLDGGTFDLADCKGQNIVILDFWSTACVPCIQSLPIVESVAREFEDQDVRLYSVNVGQTADEAGTFLKNVKWTGKAPVLLDKDMGVAKAYSVSTMPHLVIVGKNGTVHTVRVGKSNDLASELRSELESLVAGKNAATGRLRSARQKTR